MYYGCSFESYHGIVVAVHHDWPAPSEVDVLFPPITDLDQVNTGVKYQIRGCNCPSSSMTTLTCPPGLLFSLLLKS